eukprot:2728557-Amphidinium_carterae.1
MDKLLRDKSQVRTLLLSNKRGTICGICVTVWLLLMFFNLARTMALVLSWMIQRMTPMKTTMNVRRTIAANARKL